jgi:hypothetical protein
MDDQRNDFPLNFNGRLREKFIILLFCGLCLQCGLGQAACAFLIRMTVRLYILDDSTHKTDI